MRPQLHMFVGLESLKHGPASKRHIVLPRERLCPTSCLPSLKYFFDFVLFFLAGWRCPIALVWATGGLGTFPKIMDVGPHVLSACRMSAQVFWGQCFGRFSANRYPRRPSRGRSKIIVMPVLSFILVRVLVGLDFQAARCRLLLGGRLLLNSSCKRVPKRRMPISWPIFCNT